MQYLRGIIKKKEKILCDNIEVTLDITPTMPGGQNSWKGTFKLTSESSTDPDLFDKSIMFKGPYKLILEDGRSGNIHIASLVIKGIFHGITFFGDGYLM